MSRSAIHMACKYCSYYALWWLLCDKVPTCVCDQVLIITLFGVVGTQQRHAICYLQKHRQDQVLSLHLAFFVSSSPPSGRTVLVFDSREPAEG